LGNAYCIEEKTMRLVSFRMLRSALLLGTCGAALSLLSPLAQAQQYDPARMTFFVTSQNPGKGGDLGGIEGADAYCATLAAAAGAPKRTWRAYLSLAPMDGQPQVDARDRIGKGPWFNAKGVQIAASVAELHSDNPRMTKETNLTEKGEINPGYGDEGQTNIHDAITGSEADGTLAKPQVAAGRAGTPALPLPPNMTCNNYTSADPQLSTMNGHIDRNGFTANAKSWNAAHPSRGCSPEGLASTGGAGQFYCFAID
jgi:hypothetical protein